MVDVIPGYLAGALRDRPLIPGYSWRARRYPAAERAIALAEAQHGPPAPTCLGCGGRVVYISRAVNGLRCSACGRPASADVAAATGRGARRPRSIERHQCPVSGCRKLLPATKLICLDHWRFVPKRLQDAVNAAYDQGAGVGTPALAHAQDAAVAAVEAKLARSSRQEA